MTSTCSASGWMQHLPYYCQCKGAYYILLALPILIVCYWLVMSWIYGYNNVSKKDTLNRKVIDIPWLDNCCSCWPISHFLVFTLLGFMFPNCDVLIIGAGILWEVVEVLFDWFLQRSHQGMRVGDGSQLEYSGNWWAGSFKDIFADISGFYLGKFYRLLWESIRQKYSKVPPKSTQ